MRFLMWLIMSIALVSFGCSQVEDEKEAKQLTERHIQLTHKLAPEPDVVQDDIAPQPIDFAAYQQTPTEWGESVTGVKQRLQTTDKKIALTFDACGGPYGSDYDEELLSFLIEHDIPATLFINERWIDANEALFLELTKYPLFQIENHGTEHKPLSVTGMEAWDIEGTTSPEDVYDEIMTNHHTVLELTGHEMSLFRSGTAYYDEVAVKIAQDLGYQVVNFDILGDAGATYTSEQVKHALLSATEGSIVLLHMNQPQSGTAEGIKQAIPLLIEEGYEFVLLKDQILE